MAHKHILLIDDDDDICTVAGISLETIGDWRVSKAAGGREGIVLAIAEQPDAILCDVMMPDLDGPATVKLLQEDPATCDIPVVLLTARVHSADRMRFAELGVAGMIPKPFDLLTLSDEIEAVLALQPAVLAAA